MSRLSEIRVEKRCPDAMSFYALSLLFKELEKPTQTQNPKLSRGVLIFVLSKLSLLETSPVLSEFLISYRRIDDDDDDMMMDDMASF